MLPLVAYPLLKVFSPSGAASEAGIAALNVMLLQSWIPQTATTWNSPGWSLSAEAFFYCVFPFVGVVLWSRSCYRQLLSAGLVVWIFALIAPLIAIGLPITGLGDVTATAAHINADPFWASLITLNPLLRLPDFCVGILLGRAFHQLKLENSGLLDRGYWLYVPGIALEIAVVVNSSALPLALVSNGLLLPLHALVVLGLALGGGGMSRWLSIPLAVFLGNASYAMYILHFPIGKWMDLLAQRMFAAKLEWPRCHGAYLALVVALSSFVFKAIEEPANKILKRRLSGWFDLSPRHRAPENLSPR